MSFGPGTILAMTAGTYFLRLLGLTLAHRGVNETFTRLIPLFPAALLAGLVVINTFSRDGGVALDERLAGLAVSILLAMKGRGMGTIVVGGVGATALLRLIRTFV